MAYGGLSIDKSSGGEPCEIFAHRVKRNKKK
jgi:hypothetical protein